MHRFRNYSIEWPKITRCNDEKVSPSYRTNIFPSQNRHNLWLLAATMVRILLQRARGKIVRSKDFTEQTKGEKWGKTSLSLLLTTPGHLVTSARRIKQPSSLQTLILLEGQRLCESCTWHTSLQPPLPTLLAPRLGSSCLEEDLEVLDFHSC